MNLPDYSLNHVWNWLDNEITVNWKVTVIAWILNLQENYTGDPMNIMVTREISTDARSFCWDFTTAIFFFYGLPVFEKKFYIDYSSFWNILLHCLLCIKELGEYK